MTTEKMTVHRALAELKVIDKRIYDAIHSIKWTTSNKHSNQKINGKPITEYQEDVKSTYQKVTGLINRRNALKRAVVLSNATTMVTVNGIEYTVAEAIEMKNHGMNNKRELENTMSIDLNVAHQQIAANSGSVLDRKADDYVLSVIAAQPKESKMTVDSDGMKSLKKSYIEDNTYDLIDPIYVENIIKKLDEEVNAFDTEIDAALSVSNAVTVIEFEY